MEKGVKGSLSISQIAVGEENNLSISIYGEKGSLKWKQENPNEAEFNRVGHHKQILTRASFTPSNGSYANVRIPPGHPEGYLEGFANIYSDVYKELYAHINGQKYDKSNNCYPNIYDGIEGMKFIETVLDANNNNGKWIKFNPN